MLEISHPVAQPYHPRKEKENKYKRMEFNINKINTFCIARLLTELPSYIDVKPSILSLEIEVKILSLLSLQKMKSF